MKTSVSLKTNLLQDLLQRTTRFEEYYYLGGFLPCSFGPCTFFWQNDERAGFFANATGLLSRTASCSSVSGTLGLNGKAITGFSSSSVFEVLCAQNLLQTVAMPHLVHLLVSDGKAVPFFLTFSIGS